MLHSALYGYLRGSMGDGLLSKARPIAESRLQNLGGTGRLVVQQTGFQWF